MIKFFRKIRQRLLTESKFGKYLLYAIGEIVLVVIGILIALQINNMNDEKKAHIYEKKMLIEIRKALINDVDFFNNHLIGNRLQRTKRASQFFENYLVTDSINRDSINYYFKGLTTGIQITNNRGPFEALKSTGIDRIINDTLRNKIIDLYEFKLPRSTGLITQYLKEFTTNSQIQEDQLRADLQIDIQDGKVSYIYDRMKDIDLKTNQTFITLLAWASIGSKRMIGMINAITAEMEDLIKEIDIELNKNN